MHTTQQKTLRDIANMLVYPDEVRLHKRGNRQPQPKLSLTLRKLYLGVRQHRHAQQESAWKSELNLFVSIDPVCSSEQ